MDTNHVDAIEHRVTVRRFPSVQTGTGCGRVVAIEPQRSCAEPQKAIRPKRSCLGDPPCIRFVELQLSAGHVIVNEPGRNAETTAEQRARQDSASTKRLLDRAWYRSRDFREIASIESGELVL